jgi:ATP-dependent helicase HepA
VVDQLGLLAALLRQLLVNELPSLGPEWWRQGVLAKLSYQQAIQAEAQGWTDVEDLDVAAVIRVADQNWDLLRRRGVLKWDDRTLLKEAASIRNRYSHAAPGRGPSPERVYRDLDTLTLLAEALDAKSPEALELAAARAGALVAIANGGSSATSALTGAIEQAASRALAPGAMVRVKARPEMTGVVTQVERAGAQARLTVFHGSVTQTYFEGQVELVEARASERLTASQFKARITAAHVLHPSVSRLYSLNSGRIDYEPYQFRPVVKLIHADRPRLLIADDVGVGKTIEAGLIIKELQARQALDSVLVICPKPLVVEGKWRAELKRFDEDFAHLDSATLRHCIEETRAEGRWPARYRKAILPYSLLDERLLLGEESARRPRPGLVSLVPPVKFDLVIVDEAHHVRNSETWGHRVVRHLMDSAEAAVLISATPIQTGSDDLRTLLRLLRPDVFSNRQAFDLMQEPNAHLARVETAIRAAQGEWQAKALGALEQALATPWGSSVMRANPVAQDLRDILDQDDVPDAVRVKALRLTQSLNTFSALINRTRRRDIGAFTTRKPETFEVDFTSEQQQVHDALLDLARRISAERGRGRSPDFVLSTLQRQAASCLNGLAPMIADILQRRLTAEELSEADVEEENYDASILDGFIAEISQIAERAVELDDDPKLERLMGYVQEKEQLTNNKLLVFSTFRHTLAYVHDRLTSKGVRVGLVHGGIPDDERRVLRARFARDRSDVEAIDVLLSSEVGTEGLDYQFCDAIVNYDLPWNPMRIEQRIGRIDRRGQQSESIAIKNLIVSGTVDAVIYERCLLRIGVFQRALGGSEEILGDLTREIRKIGEDLTLTEAERAARLRQLADNRIGRIQEQEELEDRESALFGLSLRKLDADGVEQSISPWLAPAQLASLVRSYLVDVGYERADAIFDRPIAVLRPSQPVKRRLKQDAELLPGTATSRWRQWLDDPGQQSRRLTFDPDLAQADDIELLSPVHELVRAAAAHQGEFPPESAFALRVASNSVPEGVYPVALHSWTYLGTRDDFEVVLTVADDAIAEDLQAVLVNGTDFEAPAVDAPDPSLEDRHFENWLVARAAHLDRTRAFSRSQIASLSTSHQARVSLLEDQIADATDDRIRRMRESELRRLEEDFQARRDRLLAAIDRSDIVATTLCIGAIEVVRG